MATIPIKLQRPSTPVEVSGWQVDEDFGVYPLGAKPKRLLICPEACQDPALIPGHRYLFKTAHGWRAHQMWSELIAYHVGSLLGVHVPPCFIARDMDTQEEGILVEYFLNYPREPRKARLIHGADLVENLGPPRAAAAAPAIGNDVPQNLRTNIRMCSALGLPENSIWWTRCLAFDALIGNVDRHTQNWGLLTRGLLPEGSFDVGFAPVFDNGTSLGYEIKDENIAKVRSTGALNAYLAKGRHHAGWNAARPGPLPHTELCSILAQEHRETHPIMVEMTQFDIEAVMAFVTACTHFPTSVNFSAARADFVGLLLAARRDKLSTALKGTS